MRKLGGVKAILDYSAESDLSSEEAKQVQFDQKILRKVLVLIASSI
jgi:hypothetical protein